MDEFALSTSFALRSESDQSESSSMISISDPRLSFPKIEPDCLLDGYLKEDVLSRLIGVLSTGFASVRLLEEPLFERNIAFSFGESGSFCLSSGNFNRVPLSVFFCGGYLSFSDLIGLTGSRDEALLSYFGALLFCVDNFKYAFERRARHARSSSVAKRSKVALSIPLPLSSLRMIS